MALSDCYMLRDVQVYDSEQVLNVFFYQDLLLASIAQNVVESYEADVLPKIAAVQTDDIEHVLIDAVNLADPSNFYEHVISTPGVVSDEAEPLSIALNFGFRLNSRALRPGSKRICGIPGSAITLNTVTAGAYLTNIEALRVQFHTILLSGVLSTFQPIVIKRVKYNPDPLDLTHFAYRLPEDDGEFVFGNVIECLFNTHVSHQVSRGNGR